MTDTSEAGGLATTDRWLFRIETVFNLVAAFSIFGLMFLGVAQVLGRILIWINGGLVAEFGIDPGLWFSIPGYIDVMEQAIAIFAFLGIAYCQRMGGHVRMDLALRGLSPRMLWIAEFLAILFSLFVVAVLVYYSFTHFQRSYDSGDSTIDVQLPVWPSKLLVTVAFSLLWLRLLLQLVGFARLVGRPEADPVAVPTIMTIEEIARHDIEESDDGSDRFQPKGT
ncbi:TRAP transporter small permease subunit [Minwuia sp.]|uniref:TRAP transporter small permease subunit n=1 Tax=Minwuia sp. TaxID=2493630 RepID=UPI003A948B2C